MSEARVLAYTPTYGDLMRPETVAAMEAMQFAGVLDWHVSDDNPYPGPDMRNVVHQYQKAREMALAGGYDALLTIEHDMVPPADGAQILWDTPAPVVYGTYQFRHGTRVLNLFQKCSDTNLGMSLSMYPHELRAARKAGAWEVSGSGFGFMLVRRPILERIPFRDCGNAPDLPFAAECVQAGVVQMGRLDVDVGHYEPEHDYILGAFVRGGIISRVLALQTMTIRLADGKGLNIETGKYYSLTSDDAHMHERAGYVQITSEALEITEQIGIEVDGPAPAKDAVRETATAPETTTKAKPRARKRTASPRKASAGAKKSSK